MTSERMLEIGTQGGCGLIALAAVKRGATPFLRYDRDGTATHAAAKRDGNWINLGSDDGLTEVSLQELRRACREDFDPSRLDLRRGELQELLRAIED